MMLSYYICTCIQNVVFSPLEQRSNGLLGSLCVCRPPCAVRRAPCAVRRAPSAVGDCSSITTGRIWMKFCVNIPIDIHIMQNKSFFNLVPQKVPFWAKRPKFCLFHVKW